jgi:type IV pilus assembly protein PilM
MLFGVGAKSIFGLDIGSSSVKIIEVEKSRGGYKMTGYASVLLPEDTIIEGEIINNTEVVETIRAALKEASPSGTQVCLSVAGASVIIKHIAIPKPEKKDANSIEDQVYWEAEQYIPFDIKEISLDFEVVQEETDDGKMDVLLVAAKKDFIEKRISAVKEAGLEPEILDVDVLALANVFWENYELSEGSAAVLIDVGANLTKINIVSSTSTLFTRDVAIGGKNLTAEIQNKMGVSFQEAEVLKIDSSASEQIPAELQPLIAAINENIALEIRRSLDFFVAASSQYSISDIYICGGSCRLPGLSALLEEMIGLPVNFLNPFQKIEYGRKFNEDFINAMGPALAVPLGLAIRGQD